ncbi:hypothetical protein F3J34_30400 [Klebsiella sp. Ap-873]|nr:hypothetical protein [Klebsiella sp. Ap-873]
MIIQSSQPETTLPYRVWMAIKDSPQCRLHSVARMLGMEPKAVSSAFSKLWQTGKILRTGGRNNYLYTVAPEATHPAKYGRGPYKTSDKCGSMGRLKFVKSTAGNTIFEECRQNWQGYELNKRLREVRA